MTKQNLFTRMPVYDLKVNTLLSGKLTSKTLDNTCDLTIPLFGCIIFTLTKMVRIRTKINKHKVRGGEVKGSSTGTLDTPCDLTIPLSGCIILAKQK
jgi:hypothetical protein